MSVRTNSPAPTRSSSESDTCVTTNALPSPNRNPRWPGVTTRRSPALCLSDGVKSTRVERSAGERPNRIPVRSDNAAVKPSTRGSGLTSRLIVAFPLAMKATSRSAPQKARINPTRPPRPANSTLSVKSCRIKRARLAPTTRRTTISFCRDVARANRRLATLAQAISSTRPTTIIRIKSGFENSFRRCGRVSGFVVAPTSAAMLC